MLRVAHLQVLTTPYLPIERLADQHLAAVTALGAAVPGIDTPERLHELLRPAVERGHFRPSEEEQLRTWFARFLTVRQGLWEVMEEAAGALDRNVERITSRDHWEEFLVAYAAACWVVRLDRLLVEDVATDRLVQRKLNEAGPKYRIPRKQFTAVFKSLADPANAVRMEEAMNTALAGAAAFETFSIDEPFGKLAQQLPDLEKALDRSLSRYLSLLFRYRLHSFRRRSASANRQTSLSFLEASGRAVAELRDHWARRRIDQKVRRDLAGILLPGDVLITRQERAFSNLFLPGYWPHAALYIGLASDRARLGVEIEAARAERWTGEKCVLEALKDGVRFRPLSETLAIDAVTILRPKLEDEQIALAISRAIQHEGKLYNFDFDFFHSERLVCTEVVYRAYDGVGDLEIPLTTRAGRPTLAAEDLLDLALAGRGFDPVAIFGAISCPKRTVIQDDRVPKLLAASYSPAG